MSDLILDPMDTQVGDISVGEQEEQENPFKDDFLTIFRDIDKQERPSREPLVKLWKYMDLLWHGIAYSFWNASSSQWQSGSSVPLIKLEDMPDGIDPDIFNKTLNIIRPYGEYIAGALTTSIPRVKYFPEDADNPSDIQTAKAYSNVEKVIASQNYIKLKLIRSIVLLWNQGMAAIYNYSHANQKYGTVSKDVFSKRMMARETASCSLCGIPIGEKEYPIDNAEGVSKSSKETLELQPLGSSPPGAPSGTICPNCQGSMIPEIETQGYEDVYKTGEEKINKCRQIMEVYGPMNVKIPLHASTPEEVIWLILEQELHEAQVKNLYPDQHEKIRGGDVSDNSYERWARSNYESSSETLERYVTLRRIWLRPAAYWLLSDVDKVDALKQKYPDGVYFVLSNENFLEACPEDMDDHWTLSLNPLYDRICHDPLGKAMIPIQELTNELIQLEVETVKHAVPSTFADPEYLDFEAYRNSQVSPGMVYPMKGSPPGRGMKDVFFETRTATLPKEVSDLNARLEKFSYFISGAFPSVFGGSASGSKTLGEYQESRNQALQRLHMIWEVVQNLYGDAMARAIRGYVDDMLEDEKYVEEKGNSFINVWIRRAELTGKIGRVSPEISDQFPTSWAEKRSALMELIKLNNETIGQILLHPENAGLMADLIGLDDLYIPGDAQRNKQLSEIAYLILSEPMIGEDGLQQSSVPVELDLDDDTSHIAVLEAFMCSAQGQELKQSNPGAYANCMSHMIEHKMHMAMLQQQMMQQKAMMQGEQNENSSGPGPQ